MFYAEAILSRRGPLGKVWLAAHWERKLSKTQTLQTDIGQSVEAIVNQEAVPMALRLSGQLLLGVCRIYSRKAKYLLDDCNEALLKIKMAFRPGLVDMTEDQLAVSRNAITLQGEAFNFDLFLQDDNWDFDVEQPAGPSGQHIANQDDITLRNQDDVPFNIDDPKIDFGNGDGDWDDLHLTFGDEEEEGKTREKRKSKGKGRADTEDIDDNQSVEAGRDADVSGLHLGRPSIESALGGIRGSDFDEFETRSQRGFDDPVIQEDPDDILMDLDLRLNFGDEEVQPPADEREKTPEAVKDGSRVSSPLSAPPATPPPQVEDETQIATELTPKANEAAAPIEEQPKPKKRNLPKKQIVDAVTELEDGPGARLGRGGVNQSARDVSEITAEPEYLPRSRTVMALMHIRMDPLAHFMPTTTTERGTFFCAAPPGMAPELASLFMFPTHSATSRRRERARSEAQDEPSPKRPRLATEDPDVEQGRKDASVIRSPGAGSDIFGRELDGGEPSFGAMGEDGLDLGMQMELDDIPVDINVEQAADAAKRRASVAGTASRVPSEQPDDQHIQFEKENTVPIEEDRRSRYSTPAVDDTEGAKYSDVVCPIAMFDSRPSQNGQSLTQEVEETEVEGHSKDGYSKNTVKAIGLLRKQFLTENKATPGRRSGNTEPVLSFKKLSEKASRRAASAFFFELLVLGTRDCVKLNQASPFENVEIRAKEKFWTTESSARQPSLAPSTS